MNEEFELFKENLKKGDIFIVSFKPTDQVRIIDVIVDEISENREVTHVIYSFSMKQEKAHVKTIEGFYAAVESGLLFKMPGHKYDVGDSFYGTTGILYIIQHVSNVYRADEARRYFVTTIETRDFEECGPGRKKTWKKKYVIEEAILKESYLDSLEKYDSSMLGNGLSLDELQQMYKTLKENEWNDPNKQTGRNGYVR